MRFSLFLSIRVSGTQTLSSLTFSILFQVTADCDLEVLILEYFCIDCTLPILLKYLY